MCIPRTSLLDFQISKTEKARPPPKSTYEPPKDPIELEKIREENHRQGLHKLHQTQSLNHHYLQPEKSTKTLNQPTKPTEENLAFRAQAAPPKAQVHFPSLLALSLSPISSITSL